MAKPIAKRAATAPARENRVVRYLKEVRAELRKVTWPSRRVATNLTIIVITVTVLASAALGLVDWVFARLFALIIG